MRKVRKAGLLLFTHDLRRFPFSKSLDILMSKLDVASFCKANRQIIINYSIVSGITSLDHGKIKVLLNINGKDLQEVIVSRTRAASFRKWIEHHIN
ncbi:MAG: LytTR family DNA-binding domain-containing protein [Bacteroidota bacterium]